MVPVKGYFPSPDVGTVWTYNELLLHYYVSWCCHQMQIAPEFCILGVKKSFWGRTRVKW